MATIDVTMKSFEETVDKNEIVLLDFWAEWCGPCRTFGPIFERVSERIPDLVFGKVNTEAEQELSGAFQVRSIPTLMIFRQTYLVFEQPGLVTESGLEDLIEQVKGLDMEKVKKHFDSQNS